jgi:hypothetical protein
MSDFNPGSNEAIEQGCECPVLDNAKGRGAWGTSGDDAVFWMSSTCPLHGDNVLGMPDEK